MQVFTRCANYCKWSLYCGRLHGFVVPSRMMSFHWVNEQKQKKQTPPAKANQNTKGTSKQKPNHTKQKQNQEKVEWKHHELLVRSAMTRQLMCLVTSRPSIESIEGNNQKHHRMGRQVPSKKVAMPKPGTPPARILEIAMRGRAGMTSTNAHRPRRYAERVRKRGWNESETYRVKR